MLSRVIAKNVGDVFFLRHSVYRYTLCTVVLPAGKEAFLLFISLLCSQLLFNIKFCFFWTAAIGVLICIQCFNCKMWYSLLTSLFQIKTSRYNLIKHGIHGKAGFHYDSKNINWLKVLITALLQSWSAQQNLPLLCLDSQVNWLLSCTHDTWMKPWTELRMNNKIIWQMQV